MKILTVVGARPQFIKASAISRAIQDRYQEQIEDCLVHTGQHYDDSLSAVFFQELNLPSPKHNLHVGSSGHANQLAQMIIELERVFLHESPDAVIVYGDTNSTLAAALVTSKLEIPLVHIEAGLRSFNKSMPEETNRVLTDHVSDILFAPTQAAMDNLKLELNPQSKSTYYHCGDIMYDNSLYFAQVVEGQTKFLENIGVESQKYFLWTIHRNNNTDDLDRLNNHIENLLDIASSFEYDIVFPIHPRTKLALSKLSQDLQTRLFAHPRVKVIAPASFFEMIELEKNAKLIVTDSGGVQKEAYFFEKPALILRTETEWVEIVSTGNARLVNDSKELLREGVDFYLNQEKGIFPSIFGDGKAAYFILDTLLQDLPCSISM